MRMFGTAIRRTSTACPPPGLRSKRHAHLLALCAAVAFLAIGAGIPSGHGHIAVAIAHADADHGTLAILSPHVNASSGVPEGPAGANLVLQIQNAAHNATYSLGFAPHGDNACASAVLTPLANPSSVTTDGQGNSTFAASWPQSATTGQFDICATPSNSSLAALTATPPFQVDSANPPTISVALVPNPAATIPSGNGGGQATAGTGSSYTAGDHVEISGANFWPAGTSISIYFTVTANPQNSGDLGRPVKILSSDVNPTNQSGDFSVTVVVPGDQIGQVYVYAGSFENNPPQGALPTDLASQLISVSQPAPTPTATATATPDPTPTPASTTTTTGNGGAGHGLAIAGLGTLSVLLLVIGSMLLISAGRRPESMG